jgi:hypothetical protein
MPLRRVPRPFEDMPLSEEDANHPDNVDAPPAQSADPPQSRIRKVLLTLRDTLQTNFNYLGLCRLYPRCPSFELDKFVPSSLLQQRVQQSRKSLSHLSSMPLLTPFLT